MCEILVAKKHYRGCTIACATEDRTPRQCANALTTEVNCKLPWKETVLGQITAPGQCPNHRDEGYSRR